MFVKFGQVSFFMNHPLPEAVAAGPCGKFRFVVKPSIKVGVITLQRDIHKLHKHSVHLPFFTEKNALLVLSRNTLQFLSNFFER